MRRLGVAIAAAMLLSGGAASAGQIELNEVDSFVLDFYNGTGGLAFNGNGTVSNFGNSTEFGSATLTTQAEYLTTGVAEFLITSMSNISITDPNAHAAATPNWAGVTNNNSISGVNGSVTTGVAGVACTAPGPARGAKCEYSSATENYENVVVTNGAYPVTNATGTTTGGGLTSGAGGIEFSATSAGTGTNGWVSSNVYITVRSDGAGDIGVEEYGGTLTALNVVIIDTGCVSGCYVPPLNNNQSVPEPMTMALLATGLVGLGAMRRKAA